MSKFLHFLEGLLLPAIAVISLAVSLGDLFNVFHLIPLIQIPFLLMLIMSLALTSLGFIQNKCNEIRRDVEMLLAKAELERMDEIIAQINPDLRKVLSDDYFTRMTHLLHTAMKERRVEVDDLINFRFYFEQMLQSYPKATFLSTGSLAISHLWNDSEIEHALTAFIQGGGRIKQVFFVKSLEDRASIATKEALDLLERIGITVIVVNSSHIPSDLKKYFFVESRKKVAWEIPVDNQGHVGSSVVTADEQTIANYTKIFAKLWDNRL